jgi:molecular chaperone DnaJ
LAQRRHRDVSAGRGHYATLGVRPDATAAEIRDAYRALARRHHPDREPASAETMAAINEAYRVLGEPSRRAVYDATLRGTVSAVGPSHHPAPADAAPEATPHREPLPPARYPWKLALVMFLLGTAIVLIGAAIYKPKNPTPPDNLLEPGSCVTIELNGDAREINCTGVPGELVVAGLIGMDQRCPPGTEGHRDRQGRGLACLTTSSVP